MNITKSEELGLCSQRLNRISQLTKSYIDSGEIAGTLTLVARKGKIAHLETQGWMNLENQIPMRHDAIFRIYSMTKPVTSIAAMMLYERGEFDLITPISKFLPAFKNAEVYVSGSIENYDTEKPEREITIADLLMHTAGFTYDYTNVNTVDALYRKHRIQTINHGKNLEEFTDAAAKMPLLFSPGKFWNYSIATDILGRIIEVVSGVSLDQFFKNEIFTPLAMHDTDFYVAPDKLDRFTTNYVHCTAMPPDIREKSPEKKLFVFDDPFDSAYSKPPMMISGGGGLTSTAGDYLKFTSMLLNKGSYNHHRLVSPKSIELMTTNHLPAELHQCRYDKSKGAVMPGNGFGLGFAVNLNPAAAKSLGSGGEFGWSGAANTYFIVDPKEDMIAMFFTQLFPFDLTQEIYRRFKVAVYQSLI